MKKVRKHVNKIPGGKVFRKGKGNCRISGSSVLRCFGSRRRQDGRSVGKEGRVTENGVRERRKATRSYRPCKSF